jgi:exodeoxyribonuclease X
MNALVIDTETTGLGDPIRPVEIAWLRLGAAQPFASERFCERYDPDRAIEYGAMATHHITAGDLVGKPLWSTFRLPAGVEYLIGHNVDFDWKVIGEPPVKRICTLALARSLWPTLDSHTLGALFYYLAPERAKRELPGSVHTEHQAPERAHSAAGDAETCRTILSEILRATGRNSWEDLWRCSEAARVPKVMPFGKHKGVELAKVPADYKRWLLGQPDVDPYLRKALA